MGRNNKRGLVRNISRTSSVLESLDLSGVETLEDVTKVVEDTVDAVDTGLDILSDILMGNEYLPEIDAEEVVLDDVVEDEEDRFEQVMESIRSKRIERRKSSNESIKNKRMRVRASEALDTQVTCPACGSKTFNERAKTCNVCKLGVRAVLAAESTKPTRRKLARRNESDTYEDEDALVAIELDDETSIDASGDFAVVVGNDVEVELEDATHVLLLNVESDDEDALDGEVEVEELTLSTGVVDSHEGDVAVILFEDELVSDVVDILVDDNDALIEVVDTELGVDLVVQVVTEEVMESGEVELFEEDPVIIHIEETPEGSIVHTNEFGQVDELIEFISEMVGDAGDIEETDDESDDMDDEEVFEEPPFEDDAYLESVKVQGKKSISRRKSVSESTTPRRRNQLVRGRR